MEEQRFQEVKKRMSSPLQRLEEALGRNKVISNPLALKHHIQGLSSFGPLDTNRPNFYPLALVRAENTKDVQATVEVANLYHIPLTPRSSKSVPFHFGSHPCQDGILLDLSAMDRILSLDFKNRVAKIEPGVTWEKLTKELARHGMMIMNPLLPLPDRSVITTLLDREPPLNPKFEMGEPLLSMELIWPTGEYFRTGSASSIGYPYNFADGVYPYGPGPIDPLRLLQGAMGTMGIVTWANVKMEWRPQVNKTFLFYSSSLEQAVELVYAIQRLRLGNECLILNSTNFKLIFKTQPEKIWSTLLVLGGPRWFPDEKIAYEKDALLELLRNKFPSVQCNEVSTLDDTGYDLPHILREPCHSTPYWKTALRGAWQDIFFITLLEKVPLFVDSVTEVCRKRGVDLASFGVYVQPLEYGAGAHLEFQFFYNPYEDRKVQLINSMIPEIVENVLDLGAHFTRFNSEVVKRAVDQRVDPTYRDVAIRIKRIVDPNMIMNPDRFFIDGGGVC